MPSTRNDPASSATDPGALLSRRRWFLGARAGARNGSGARRNDAWGLPRDAGALFFDRAALRGDAWEGLIDVPGAVFEAPGAVFGAWAGVFAAGALLSDVGDEAGELTAASLSSLGRAGAIGPPRSLHVTARAPLAAASRGSSARGCGRVAGRRAGRVARHAPAPATRTRRSPPACSGCCRS